MTHSALSGHASPSSTNPASPHLPLPWPPRATLAWLLLVSSAASQSRLLCFSFFLCRRTAPCLRRCCWASQLTVGTGCTKPTSSENLAGTPWLFCLVPVARAHPLGPSHTLSFCVTICLPTAGHSLNPNLTQLDVLRLVPTHGAPVYLPLSGARLCWALEHQHLQSPVLRAIL